MSDKPTAIDLGEIEIFRTGRHTPMNGNSMMFPLSMLQEVAATFDPAKNPVPVVIGHPKTNAPAYAWIDTLTVKGDVLVATFKKMHKGFAQIVKDGRYSRVSAAFYAPDTASNPADDKWSLRHVGFLGAAAPAVKGLKPVEFAMSDDGIISFNEYEENPLPAEFERRLQRMENNNMLESLVSKGKVLPRFMDNLLCFMESLEDDSVLSFAEGVDETPLDWFRNYLGQQPTVIQFGSVVTNDYVEPVNPNFAAPEGYGVDEGQIDLHAKATRIMKEQNIPFAQALEIAQDE